MGHLETSLRSPRIKSVCYKSKQDTENLMNGEGTLPQVNSEPRVEDPSRLALECRFTVKTFCLRCWADSPSDKALKG